MLRVEADPERLRRVRFEAGLTQLEVAGLAGVSERTVRNAESGRQVKKDFLEFIAGALEVPVDEVLRSEVRERNVQRILQAWRVFFDSGDFSEFGRLFTPTIEVIQPGPEHIPIFGHFRGTEVERFVKDVCAPLVPFRTAPRKIESINAARDFVCIYWTDSGLGFSSGRVAEKFACMHLYEFENERVTRMRTLSETEQIIAAFQ